jgi:hypothetical protein
LEREKVGFKNVKIWYPCFCLLGMLAKSRVY